MFLLLLLSLFALFAFCCCWGFGFLYTDNIGIHDMSSVWYERWNDNVIDKVNLVFVRETIRSREACDYLHHLRVSPSDADLRLTS